MTETTDTTTVAPSRWAAARPWVAAVARVALGVVWIVAGASKATDLAGSVRAVRAYRLLPEWSVPVVGAALPFCEIALGLLLIVGLGVRFGAIVSGLVLAVFIVGIASAAARGLRIDCGCFGGGGDLAEGQRTQYTSELVRDGGLLALSGIVGWLRGGRFAADGWITGGAAAPDDEESSE